MGFEFSIHLIIPIILCIHNILNLKILFSFILFKVHIFLVSHTRFPMLASIPSFHIGFDFPRFLLPGVGGTACYRRHLCATSLRHTDGGEKTRSFQTDCSSDWKRDHSCKYRTQMAINRRAEDNSAIDHSQQARKTEFRITSAVKT